MRAKAAVHSNEPGVGRERRGFSFVSTEKSKMSPWLQARVSVSDLIACRIRRPPCNLEPRSPEPDSGIKREDGGRGDAPEPCHSEHGRVHGLGSGAAHILGMQADVYQHCCWEPLIPGGRRNPSDVRFALVISTQPVVDVSSTSVEARYLRECCPNRIRLPLVPLEVPVQLRRSPGPARGPIYWRVPPFRGPASGAAGIKRVEGTCKEEAGLRPPALEAGVSSNTGDPALEAPIAAMDLPYHFLVAHWDALLASSALLPADAALEAPRPAGPIVHASFASCPYTFVWLSAPAAQRATPGALSVCAVSLPCEECIELLYFHGHQQVPGESKAAGARQASPPSVTCQCRAGGRGAAQNDAVTSEPLFSRRLRFPRGVVPLCISEVFSQQLLLVGTVSHGILVLDLMASDVVGGLSDLGGPAGARYEVGQAQVMHVISLHSLRSTCFPVAHVVGVYPSRPPVLERRDGEEAVRGLLAAQRGSGIAKRLDGGVVICSSPYEDYVAVLRMSDSMYVGADLSQLFKRLISGMSTVHPVFCSRGADWEREREREQADPRASTEETGDAANSAGSRRATPKKPRVEATKSTPLQRVLQTPRKRTSRGDDDPRVKEEGEAGHSHTDGLTRETVCVEPHRLARAEVSDERDASQVLFGTSEGNLVQTTLVGKPEEQPMLAIDTVFGKGVAGRRINLTLTALCGPTTVPQLVHHRYIPLYRREWTAAADLSNTVLLLDRNGQRKFVMHSEFSLGEEAPTTCYHATDRGGTTAHDAVSSELNQPGGEEVARAEEATARGRCAARGDDRAAQGAKPISSDADSIERSVDTDSRVTGMIWFPAHDGGVHVLAAHHRHWLSLISWTDVTHHLLSD